MQYFSPVPLPGGGVGWGRQTERQTERKKEREGKKQPGTISKSNSRMNPIQSLFLIVWSDFMLHLFHERDNRKEN